MAPHGRRNLLRGPRTRVSKPESSLLSPGHCDLRLLLVPGVPARGPMSAPPLRHLKSRHLFFHNLKKVQSLSLSVYLQLTVDAHLVAFGDVVDTNEMAPPETLRLPAAPTRQSVRFNLGGTRDSPAESVGHPELDPGNSCPPEASGDGKSLVQCEIGKVPEDNMPQPGPVRPPTPIASRVVVNAVSRDGHRI